MPGAIPVVSTGTGVTLGIRPEHVTVNANGPIVGHAIITERLGGLTLLHVELPGGQMLVVQTDGADATRVHENVRLSISGAHAHVFDADGVAAAHLERHALLS